MSLCKQLLLGCRNDGDVEVLLCFLWVVVYKLCQDEWVWERYPKVPCYLKQSPRDYGASRILIKINKYLSIMLRYVCTGLIDSPYTTCAREAIREQEERVYENNQILSKKAKIFLISTNHWTGGRWINLIFIKTRPNTKVLSGAIKYLVNCLFE